MRNIIRSFEDSFRNFMRQWKQAKRFSSRVPVRVSLLEFTNKGTKIVPIMSGYTFNLSSTGLALVLPDIALGGRSLIKKSNKLVVALDLPGGVTRLHTRPIHFRRASRYIKTTGFIIGMQIIEIDESSRERYLKFLNRAKKGEKIASKWSDKNPAST